MAILSDIETKLLDEYYIKHNITDDSEAMFTNSISMIVPSWRLEQLTEHDFGNNEAHQNYMKILKFDKKV